MDRANDILGVSEEEFATAEQTPVGEGEVYTASPIPIDSHATSARNRRLSGSHASQYSYEYPWIQDNEQNDNAESHFPLTQDELYQADNDQTYGTPDIDYSEPRTASYEALHTRSERIYINQGSASDMLS
jgi:hypothetical protein